MYKFAIVLCGCGNMDGSEIHEATFAIEAIDSLGGEYSCFALDEPQARVMNFLDKTATTEKRNQLQESARIARGNIHDLRQLQASDFDALVLPGGFGAAFNLCTFGLHGSSGTVNPQARRVIKAFYEAQKPIGLICIAPAVLALALGPEINPTITAGTDEKSEAAESYRKLGCTVLPCATDQSIADSKNLIYSTPAYMKADAKISEVRMGIHSMLSQIFAQLKTPVTSGI